MAYILWEDALFLCFRSGYNPENVTNTRIHWEGIKIAGNFSNTANGVYPDKQNTY